MRLSLCLVLLCALASEQLANTLRVEVVVVVRTRALKVIRIDPCTAQNARILGYQTPQESDSWVS